MLHTYVHLSSYLNQTRVRYDLLYVYVLVLYIHFFLCGEVVQLLSLNFGRDEATADTVEWARRYLEVDGIKKLSAWPKDKLKHINTSVETAIAVADLQVLLLYVIIIIRRSAYMYSAFLVVDLQFCAFDTKQNIDHHPVTHVRM